MFSKLQLFYLTIYFYLFGVCCRHGIPMYTAKNPCLIGIYGNHQLTKWVPGFVSSQLHSPKSAYNWNMGYRLV